MSDVPERGKPETTVITLAFSFFFVA
jgi:hypothetical protein